MVSTFYQLETKNCVLKLVILPQVCGLEECNAKMQEDKQFTDNREALLEPVREQAERLRRDLELVNP